MDSIKQKKKIGGGGVRCNLNNYYCLKVKDLVDWLIEGLLNLHVHGPFLLHPPSQLLQHQFSLFIYWFAFG